MTSDDDHTVDDDLAALRDRVADLAHDQAVFRQLLSRLADADDHEHLDFVEKVDRVVERVADIEARLDDLEATVERLDAVVKRGCGSKLAKHQAIVEQAHRNDTGRGAVGLTTGEVAAAARCSEQHARTLMTELHQAIEWVRKKPGHGPSDPDRLLVTTRDRDVDAAREAVREAYERGDLEASA